MRFGLQKAGDDAFFSKPLAQAKPWAAEFIGGNPMGFIGICLGLRYVSPEDGKHCRSRAAGRETAHGLAIRGDAWPGYSILAAKDIFVLHSGVLQRF
ncbi:MAG: hypothetical protein ACNI3A_13970 [Desulfovibrio sp.]|uniref:hypothetical protein n=1 Tax=Desulfovibrio sp. 7SRBS1 TaxID=3378064 RepID=UPI003B3D3A95